MLPNSHLTTDFVCNQHTTAVSSPRRRGRQSKCLISYFLQVIVLSTHSPPSALCLTPVVARQVTHFSAIPFPCISSRWLCSIISIYTCQARFEAIFSFTLWWFDWKWSMLSIHEFMLTFYQWYWTVTVFKKAWYQPAFSVISELCEYHNCC